MATTLAKQPIKIPTPKELGLAFDSWRPGQLRAIEWVMENNWLEDYNSPTPYKVIEAPVGTGKTPFALAIGKMIMPRRTLILCSTKLEQVQFEAQLSSNDADVVSIVGKNNWHCILDPMKLGHKIDNVDELYEKCEAQGCTKIHVDEAPCTVGHFKCEIKSICPYFSKVTTARMAKVVVTNYSYGLAMLNYAPTALGKFDLIICDEAHLIDSELERFIELKLSRRTLDRSFGITLPYYGNKDNLTVWQIWAEKWKGYFEDVVTRLGDIEPELLGKDETKKYNSAKHYFTMLERIIALDDSWIIEEEEKVGVSFQPIWVKDEARATLWDLPNRTQEKKFIIMSGTIPDKNEVSKKIGLPPGQFGFLRLPYTFDVEHRPIILDPVGDMSRKGIDETLPKLAETIDKYIAANFRKKMLIHTWSYRIRDYLMEHCDFADIFYTHDSRNRIEVLDNFKRSKAPSALVSPSMDKAVDLPGDQCELIIICKLPYPYLGTKVMQKRLKLSRGYYQHETLSGLIQMSGRGVRTETDICTTIVLDGGAPKFLAQVSRMVPSAIQEAIREVNN